jgi:hypothetical protein
LIVPDLGTLAWRQMSAFRDDRSAILSRRRHTVVSCGLDEGRQRAQCILPVVFRGGLPASLIDFDLAKPTTRVVDLVNALYWWAPLLHPMDRAPALAGVDVAARVRAFADAYGMTAVQRALVVPPRCDECVTPG